MPSSFLFHSFRLSSSNRPQFIHRRNLSAPWSPLLCRSFLIHKSGQTSSFPWKSVVGSTRLICRKHFGQWPGHKKSWRNGGHGHYRQWSSMPWSLSSPPASFTSQAPTRTHCAPLYLTGLLLWAHARSRLSRLHFSGIFKTPTFLPRKNFLPRDFHSQSKVESQLRSPPAPHHVPRLRPQPLSLPGGQTG